MVRVAGRVKEVREEQPRKALLSMVVARAAGMLRSMREQQSRNAPWPIVVWPAGRVSIYLYYSGENRLHSLSVT